MRYVLAGLLGIFISSIMTASITFAASAKGNSVNQAAGALADRFLDLDDRKASQDVRKQKTNIENSMPKQAQVPVKPPQHLKAHLVGTQARRELEWQLKLNTLSEKLRLARKNFNADEAEPFGIHATSNQ